MKNQHHKRQAGIGRDLGQYLGRGMVAFVLLLALSGLSACNLASRLARIGEQPEISAIQNPLEDKNYQPVRMPTPVPLVQQDNPNSLWKAGARAFFRDHRAKGVGDILTVKLALNDSASLTNATSSSRKTNEESGIQNILGRNKDIPIISDLPVGAGNLLNFNGSNSRDGSGSISRKEAISIQLAAVVTQVLPNGNFVLMGRQEVLVNSEMRELMLTGVVRAGDIDSDNAIDHTKIAEMRVAYGGRGTLSDALHQRWGSQIWDVVAPF